MSRRRGQRVCPARRRALDHKKSTSNSARKAGAGRQAISCLRLSRMRLFGSGGRSAIDDLSDAVRRRSASKNRHRLEVRHKPALRALLSFSAHNTLSRPANVPGARLYMGGGVGCDLTWTLSFLWWPRVFAQHACGVQMPWPIRFFTKVYFKFEIPVSGTSAGFQTSTNDTCVFGDRRAQIARNIARSKSKARCGGIVRAVGFVSPGGGGPGTLLRADSRATAPSQLEVFEGGRRRYTISLREQPLGVGDHESASFSPAAGGG